MKHEFMCKQCGYSKEITGTNKQWDAYIYKGKNIQDVFPELTKGDRELILSGICGECFDEIFNRR